ncbi:hypothetical protein [Desulfuromonas acetoxidans]|uniref:hypothetical protein n=1 Tax=Desulfuromonas acetoxidans TaxID=891 RepID=UPI0029317DDA|nr:hypothetical protein [Desulfuromonas acetoxidans]
MAKNKNITWPQRCLGIMNLKRVVVGEPSQAIVHIGMDVKVPLSQYEAIKRSPRVVVWVESVRGEE